MDHSRGSEDVASALNYLIEQSEVLTQTVAMMEQRLTLNEDRWKRFEGQGNDAANGSPHLEQTFAEAAEVEPLAEEAKPAIAVPDCTAAPL